MTQGEEILRDRIALLERSIEACEKSKLNAGINVVDADGNFVEHISFHRDDTELREQLAKAEAQLASLQ